MNGLLNGIKMFIYSIKKKDREYVIVLKLTHYCHTFIEGIKFSNCIANGMIIGEIDLKTLKK